MIELADRIPNTSHFKWAEALFLEKLGFHAFPQQDIVKNILRIAWKMQMIRDEFGRPIKVHSWYRPKKYNEMIKGSEKSAHIDGLAVDFSVEGLDCDEVRERLEPKLEEWKIRMERMPGANWVHIDVREPGPSGRYFKP